MTEENVYEGVKYILSYPDGFCPDKQYPLVVFLHGSGTRGDCMERLKKNVSFVHLAKRQTRGYILLAPLCGCNNWNEIMAPLIGLVETVRDFEYIDRTRVYLTGVSMGGYGTWELASLRPQWFAAIMPLCGGGMPWMTGTLVDVPVRAFHGICDDIVNPAASLEMIRALNRQGGHGELILFPNLGHNCWVTVYSTEENYDWLLGFTTCRAQTNVEQYTGDRYG